MSHIYELTFINSISTKFCILSILYYDSSFYITIIAYYCQYDKHSDFKITYILIFYWSTCEN